MLILICEASFVHAVELLHTHLLHVLALNPLLLKFLLEQHFVYLDCGYTRKGLGLVRMFGRVLSWNFRAGGYNKIQFEHAYMFR